MPRMEIELTSTREDGQWTWRAAGARQPRGTMADALVPDGTSVGDVLRVEVEQFMDGIEVTSVLVDRAERSEPETLEMLGSGQNEPLVTTKLAGRRGRRRDEDGPRGRSGRDRRPRRDDKKRDDDKGAGRKDRRPRRDDEKRDDEKRDDKKRDDKKRDDDKGAGRKDRRSRRDDEKRDDDKGAGRKGRPNRRSPAPPDAEAKPRARRLRPKRTHRKAAIAALPEDQQPLARILARDGVPGVRSAIETQNAAAEAVDEPGIPAELLLKLAERIHPNLRTADWRDRAESALAGIEDIDLRDIRSVVVAAETAARGPEDRELADRLREALTARVDREHKAWIGEVTSALSEDRVVRALRLSSRPPKAGAPLPSPILDRLAAAAEASLTSDTGQDRWATVLDAVALSPVHQRVTPAGLPIEPTEQLLDVVKRVSMSVPSIAASFGVEPTPPRRGRRSRPRS